MGAYVAIRQAVPGGRPFVVVQLICPFILPSQVVQQDVFAGGWFIIAAAQGDWLEGRLVNACYVATQSGYGSRRNSWHAWSAVEGFAGVLVAFGCP